jgi:hypothetical protein
MTCERIEDLLSPYMEGELSPEDMALVEAHLESSPASAELLGLLREAQDALARFPEVEPGPELMARLSAIPIRKRRLKPVFDLLLRPALQPVYAAFTVLLMFVSFVFFVPQGQGIRKAVTRQIHAGYGEVEKLYAKAGSLTDELGELKDSVIHSIKTLNPLKGQEEKP